MLNVKMLKDATNGSSGESDSEKAKEIVFIFFYIVTLFLPVFVFVRFRRLFSE